MNARTVTFVVLIAAISAVFIGPVLVAPSWLYVYEDATFALAPTAERAYEYGTRRFDAQHAHLYDFGRAEYFFERAFELDPELPYLNHQRARVAFLKGNMRTALARINVELGADNDQVSHSSYYVRGLILGYMGRYAEAAEDYEVYLEYDPNNWAALNDHAWVLLKNEQYDEALQATTRGVAHFPENPWLLNSHAVALFELGRFDEALPVAEAAVSAAEKVTEREWLIAYPGNDPRIAPEGMERLRNSVIHNRERIVLYMAE